MAKAKLPVFTPSSRSFHLSTTHVKLSIYPVLSALLATFLPLVDEKLDMSH